MFTLENLQNIPFNLVLKLIRGEYRKSFQVEDFYSIASGTVFPDINYRIYKNDTYTFIVLRSSDTWLDVIIDALLWIPWRLPNRKGWWSFVLSIYSFFFSLTISNHAKSLNTIFIGHSLGAAYAGMLGFLHNRPAICLNGPRWATAKAAQEVSTPILNYLHNGDIVTKVPPFFVHPGKNLTGGSTRLRLAHHQLQALEEIF